MSVYKSKRGESSIQFIEVARKIECHTLEQCLKVPKRYTFLLTTRIMSLASDVYDHVVSANSIYPTNQHEAQTRRDHLIAANEHAFMTWGELINEEAKLISGIRRSDRARYKDLPD